MTVKVKSNLFLMYDKNTYSFFCVNFIFKILLSCKKFPIRWIIAIYFLVRFPKLTLLPIFNDESIYLDWAWRMTHTPGLLYYSLYDAKQPLVMWLYGIFSSILPDPLFAGRFVSLLLGLLTTIGIYFVGKDFFSKKTALIAAVAYIIIPIFVHFDRQALLESAVTASGVWGLFFVNKTIKNEKFTKDAILAGLILGLGFFSKSSALLFLFPTVLLYILEFYKHKNSKFLKSLLMLSITFTLTILLLIINPQFWQTFSTNSRYVFTLAEISKLPIYSWFFNIYALLQILFFFVTPFVFVISIIQILKLIRYKTTLLIWLGIPLLITIFTLKTPSQRYLVSFLPFLTILFASFFENFKSKRKIHLPILTVSLITPFIISSILIYNPLTYFQSANKISSFSEYLTVSGQSSGYGINKTIKYLEKENAKNKIIVTYAENTGNPESALSIYLSKQNIMNGYFEMKYLEGIAKDAECIQLQSGQDIYFISRFQQLAGFENYVEKIKTIRKPIGNDTIGIYKFIKGCKNPIIVDTVFNGI